MSYSFEKLHSLIGDNKLWLNFISIMNNVTGSSLIEGIGELLRDNSYYYDKINDRNKVSLVSFVRRYYIDCADFLIERGSIKKLVKASKRVIYKINARNGLRVATKYEVENGVEGLLEYIEYPIGEEKYRLLNLLLWTIEGRLRYYREAGYDYNYSDRLEDSIYDLIVRSADGLVKLLNWIEDKETFTKDMEKLNSLIRLGDYKYPEYAEDEVKTSLSIKQLIYYLDNNIPKQSKDKDMKYALHLVLKVKDKKRNILSPLEVSFLRGIYRKLIQNNLRSENIKNDTLQKECEDILRAREEGLIDGNHFVFKIINTLKSNDYKKCSLKQHNIIRDALNIIEKTKKDKEYNEQELEIYESLDISSILED